MNVKQFAVKAGDKIDSFISHPYTVAGFCLSLPVGFYLAGEAVTNVYISIVTAMILFFTAANNRTNDLATQKKLDQLLVDEGHADMQGLEERCDDEIRETKV